MDDMQNREEEFEGMTDLQFYAIDRDKWEMREIELRRELEHLSCENELLRKSGFGYSGGMTDAQSRRFEELVRENEAFRHQLYAAKRDKREEELRIELER